MTTHRPLHRSRKWRGFTLVELAIVLAVASLLFAGLWRLMSAGSTQLREQAAAEQMNQLVAAVRNFLASGEGEQYRVAMLGAANTKCVAGSPTLSSTGNDCVGDLLPAQNPAAGTFASFLPPGFSATTENPYGQTYVVKTIIPLDSDKGNYSFMIKTENGTTIVDSSGGRIAAIIGGDGGFIYSGDVCATKLGVATSRAACGSYGGWAIDINRYDFAQGSGFLTARSVGGLTAQAPWLAREAYGDPAVFNTMHTALGFEAGVAPINMNGNPINLQGGDIDGSVPTADLASYPSGKKPDSKASDMLEITVGDEFNNSGPGFTVLGPANGSLLSGPGGTSYEDDCGQGGAQTNCAWIASVNGNMKVGGMLYATNLYAQSFVYETSDMRLKKDIKKLEHPLEDLAKIPAVSFVRIDGDKPGLGVIAQDVEKVYPELISPIGDGMKSVDYLGLIGPLIGAVQELKTQNDALREQIIKNAKTIEQLQERIAKKPNRKP